MKIDVSLTRVRTKRSLPRRRPVREKTLAPALCYTDRMKVVGQIVLKAAADAAAKLAFYEWAYGRLAEADSDVGILGEFMCGLYVGGLEARRREKAPCDLVASSGETVEVKTALRSADAS